MKWIFVVIFLTLKLKLNLRFGHFSIHLWSPDILEVLPTLDSLSVGSDRQQLLCPSSIVQKVFLVFFSYSNLYLYFITSRWYGAMSGIFRHFRVLMTSHYPSKSLPGCCSTPCFVVTTSLSCFSNLSDAIFLCLWHHFVDLHYYNRLLKEISTWINMIIVIFPLNCKKIKDFNSIILFSPLH